MFTLRFGLIKTIRQHFRRKRDKAFHRDFIHFMYTHLNPVVGDTEEHLRVFLLEENEKHLFPDDAEYIWRVGIVDPQGKVYSIARPGAHIHVVWLMNYAKADGAKNLHAQGFVTTHGRYVGRPEALEIARTRGQLLTPEIVVSSDLFSEDMWNIGDLPTYQLLLKKHYPEMYG